MQDAKVEMNLTPRLVEMNSGDKTAVLPGQCKIDLYWWCQ